MKVLVIPVTGDIEVREIEGLEGMQAVVGGYIECVGIREDLDLWCNEDGWALGLEYNVRATTWLNTIQDGVYHLLGDVFLTGGVDDEGETLSITDQEVYHTKGNIEALSHIIDIIH